VRLPPPGWKRKLAIAGVIVVALRLALPFAIEKVAERQASAALGVPLRVGDVDLRLLWGGLAIEDLRIGDKRQPLDVAEIDPAHALFALEHAYARIAWLDLLRGRLHLRELDVAAPHVRVAREADGRIEPLPVRPAAAEAAPAEAAESGAGLRLTVDQFVLRSARLGLLDAADATRELLAFDLDELTLANFALDQEGISLGAIGIRRPRLRVQRELALEGATPATAPAAKAPATAVPAAPASARPPFRARHIEIERAAFTLQMAESGLDVVMHLKADGVTAVRGETFPAKVSLELAQGTLEAEGTVGVDPPLFDGALRWQGIAVRPLLEPLPGNRIQAVESATTGGNLKLALALAPADGSAPELRVRGTLGLTGVKAKHPEQELAVAWKSLDVEIDELRVPLTEARGAAPRVALRKIRLVEPVARIVKPPAPAAEPGETEETAQTNASAETTPPVGSGPAPVQPKVSLASLELVGGRVELVDRSVEPEYRAQLRQLNVGARDVRWPEGDVRDLHAAFVGPAEAALDLRGALRNRSGELDLKIERLALAGFNPYAKSLAGVEVSRGNFSLDAHAKAERGNWDVRSQLRAHDLSLASGGSGMVPSVGLPISAVLALLRDSSGDIKLGVPLQIDAQGTTRAGLRSIIVSALRQTLVGLVSSPLKILGFATGAGGSDSDQRAALSCEPGDLDLADSEAERVNAIVALLSERPALGLVLRGRAGGADAKAVAEQMLRERLEAGNAVDLPESGFLQRRRLRKALDARARGEPDELEPEDREALDRWIAATPVPPERLQALAALRAELLLENLATLQAVPRARLSLADPLEGEPAVALEITAVSASRIQEE